MNGVAFFLELLGSLAALLLGRSLPLFFFELIYAYLVAYVLYWLVVLAVPANSVGNDYQLVAIGLVSRAASLAGGQRDALRRAAPLHACALCFSRSHPRHRNCRACRDTLFLFPLASFSTSSTRSSTPSRPSPRSA